MRETIALEKKQMELLVKQREAKERKAREKEARVMKEEREGEIREIKEKEREREMGVKEREGETRAAVERQNASIPKLRFLQNWYLLNQENETNVTIAELMWSACLGLGIMTR